MSVREKEKQYTVIEFVLLERCAGNEMLAYLQNMYNADVYCRSSVFKKIQETRVKNEELLNEEDRGRSWKILLIQS
jgi:hypothetical protein